MTTTPNAPPARPRMLRTALYAALALLLAPFLIIYVLGTIAGDRRA